MKQNGGPAFPHASVDEKENIFLASSGMTLRDWFAGKALQGLMANSEGVHAGAEPLGSWLTNASSATAPEWLAKRVYEISDAMLTERDKP